MKDIPDSKWKLDFWTVFFAILSLILANLAIFIPSTPTSRLIILGFLITSIIFAVMLFYINNLIRVEKEVRLLKVAYSDLCTELTEKFNYLKEINTLKVDVEMLKKGQRRKAQVDILTLIKIIVAIILIYVIFQVIKSFSH